MSFERRPNLLRIESERFELSAPFRGPVTESLDTDTARQTTFGCGLDAGETVILTRRARAQAALFADG